MTRDISEPQRAWLAGELDAWRAAGIVTVDQVKAVLGLYVTSTEASRREQSKMLRTLVAMSGLLVAMGVLLLIGYNWEAMPAAAKVATVFAAIIGAHGLGFWLRYGVGNRVLSETAFFFGCLLYGAGIWLIAQVFHVSGHDPDAFWWWAVGVLPFALMFETVLLHTLLVALLAIWAGYEILGFSDIGAWFFGRWPVAPNGAFSLLILAAPGMWWAYRKQSAAALGLYVPLLVWWVALQPFAWGLKANPVFFIGAVGGLLLLVAETHRPGSTMAIPYRFYGAGLIAGVLVPLSFKEFNTHGAVPAEILKGIYLNCAIVVMGAAGLTVVALMRRRSKLKPLSEELLEIGRRQWMPCGSIALMVFLGFWDVVIAEPLMPTVAANAAMIVFALWLMQVGLREDRGQPFAAGVLYLLLWAILRYADLFGAFGGMLGAALVFFLCGAILFGVAMFWRHRKEVHLA
jgi:uncharacterized membrane protein